MDVPITCVCPPRADGPRHPEGDIVTLRDRLDFQAAITIRKAMALAQADGITDPAEILAIMTRWYCTLGIEAWSLADATGRPLPLTRENVRSALLENPAAYDQIVDIADAADELYMPVVLLPLLVRASKSSPTTQTETSTSAPTGSKARHPRPSKPSSITSTPTDGIGPTSGLPDGVSSISRSSASAA